VSTTKNFTQIIELIDSLQANYAWYMSRYLCFVMNNVCEKP